MTTWKGRKGPSPTSPTHPSPRHSITLAVVGLSGPEPVKGPLGVGKSCLANRFVRPGADEYQAEQLGALSHADFSSPVVDHDHWLYFGSRLLALPDEEGGGESGDVVEVRVIEQTELLSDETFEALGGPREPYFRRAAATRLSSPDKLAYICRDQLGLETDYPQISLEPQVRVDGFLLVFDVSPSPGRTPAEQSAFLTALLSEIGRTKRPAVLAACKCDEAESEGLREAERLQQRKEARALSGGLPLVQTSAALAVNVEAAFQLLACLVLKTKGRPRPSSFGSAWKEREAEVERRRVSFRRRLRIAVSDHRETWPGVRRQLNGDTSLLRLEEVGGSEAARAEFARLQTELREAYQDNRLRAAAARLPEALAALLPPDGEELLGQPWDSVLVWLQKLPQFHRHFVPPDAPTATHDPRLPTQLLYSPQAESYYHQYQASIAVRLQRQRLVEDFESLLKNCSQVTPGKPMDDLRIFFLGKPEYECLSEELLHQVYDRYQEELTGRARRDFQELLLESVEEIARRLGPGGLSDGGLSELRDRLEEDSRYRFLNRFAAQRDAAVANFAAWLRHPLPRHCAAGPRCLDSLLAPVLSSSLPPAPPPPPASQRRLNLLVLGAHSLPHSLLGQIRHHLPEDLYHSELVYDEALDPIRISHALDYRAVNGDLTSPGNGLDHPDFPVDALVGVFSDGESLDWLRDSLASAVLSSATAPESEEGPSPVSIGIVSGTLPLALILTSSGLPTAEPSALHPLGLQLAESLRCPLFVGESDDREEVVSEMLSHLVGVLSPEPEMPEPELRLQLCLHCGDSVGPHTLLAPWLAAAVPGGHSAHSQSSKDSHSFLVRIYLPRLGRNIVVELSVSSLHTAISGHVAGRDPGHPPPDTFHGYILAYSTSRLASLAGVRCLGSLVERWAGLLLVGVGEVTEVLHTADSLLAQGSQLAEALGASFLTLSPATTAHRNIPFPNITAQANLPSLAGVRCLGSLVERWAGLLLVGVGEVTEVLHTADSLLAQGSQLAEALGASFLTLSPATTAHRNIPFPNITAQANLPSLAGVRCLGSLVERWAGLLLVGVGEVTEVLHTADSLLAQGSQLAEALGASFLTLSPATTAHRNIPFPNITAQANLPSLAGVRCLGSLVERWAGLLLVGVGEVTEVLHTADSLLAQGSQLAEALGASFLTLSPATTAHRNIPFPNITAQANLPSLAGVRCLGSLVERWAGLLLVGVGEVTEVLHTADSLLAQGSQLAEALGASFLTLSPATTAHHNIPFPNITAQANLP